MSRAPLKRRDARRFLIVGNVVPRALYAGRSCCDSGRSSALHTTMLCLYIDTSSIFRLGYFCCRGVRQWAFRNAFSYGLRQGEQTGSRLIRSIHNLSISEFRLLGSSPWTRESHPWELSTCSSQTLRSPDSSFVDWPFPVPADACLPKEPDVVECIMTLSRSSSLHVSGGTICLTLLCLTQAFFNGGE